MSSGSRSSAASRRASLMAELLGEAETLLNATDEQPSTSLYMTAEPTASKAVSRQLDPLSSLDEATRIRHERRRRSSMGRIEPISVPTDSSGDGYTIETTKPSRHSLPSLPVKVSPVSVTPSGARNWGQDRFLAAEAGNSSEVRSSSGAPRRTSLCLEAGYKLEHAQKHFTNWSHEENVKRATAELKAEASSIQTFQLASNRRMRHVSSVSCLDTGAASMGLASAGGGSSLPQPGAKRSGGRRPSLSERFRSGVEAAIGVVRDPLHPSNRIEYFRAADLGRHGTIEKFLNDALPIDYVDDVGRTALIIACTSARQEVVDLLLSRGACVAVVDNKGWTALHYAVRHGHARIVDRLLDGGANRNMPTRDDGASPLVLACRHGGIFRIVKALVGNLEVDGTDDTRAQLNCVDADGMAALHYAAWKEQQAVCRLLVLAGADTTIRDKKGQAPTNWAGRESKVQAVLESGHNKLAKARQKLAVVSHLKHLTLVKAIRAGTGKAKAKANPLMRRGGRRGSNAQQQKRRGSNGGGGSDEETSDEEGGEDGAGAANITFQDIFKKPTLDANVYKKNNKNKRR